MRSVLNMAYAWGKSVHNFCTTCVFRASLYTRSIVGLSNHVHKPSEKAASYARLIRLFMHRKNSLFQSVKTRVMPTVHTPYKENNKSKVLKITLLISHSYKAVPGAKP